MTFKSHEKEYIKEYNQDYYAKNKEKWLERVRCDVCHIEVCQASYSKHLKSKQHLRLSKWGNQVASSPLQEE